MSVFSVVGPCLVEAVIVSLPLGITLTPHSSTVRVSVFVRACVSVCISLIGACTIIIILVHVCMTEEYEWAYMMSIHVHCICT